MIESIWARLSGREKLVAYAVGIMIVAHLVGVLMSEGYYAGDFADGGTWGMVAILAGVAALGAVAARNRPSGPVALPASYGTILLVAGAIPIIIGLLLLTQISGANSDTISYFRALHPTAPDMEIPMASYLAPAGLALGGFLIAFVGWRERAAGSGSARRTDASRLAQPQGAPPAPILASPPSAPTPGPTTTLPAAAPTSAPSPVASARPDAGTRCPACSAALPVGAAFCPACGARQ